MKFIMVIIMVILNRVSKGISRINGTLFIENNPEITYLGRDALFFARMYRHRASCEWSLFRRLKKKQIFSMKLVKI